jgi:hypothetical protein
MTTTSCPESRREDGQHSWEFDGDDPRIRCVFCGELQDALTGRVLRPARTEGGTSS